MKRKFKFRAWDNKFNVMLPQVAVYDNENVIIVDVFFNECYGDQVDERHEIGVEDAGPEHYCITGDLNIMQFTGLIGNGKIEIYEGDIVTLEDNEGQLCPPYIIEWDEKVFNFIGRCIDGQDWLMLEEFECSNVIGNIHQHPDFISSPPLNKM